MRFWNTASAVVVALTGVVVSGPALAQSGIAQAFGALPAMQSPALSPDGKQIAFVNHRDTSSFVFVATLDGMAVTAAIDTGTAQPQAVTWASPTALVFAAGAARGGNRVVGSGVVGAPYGVDLSGDAVVTPLLQARNDVQRRSAGTAENLRAAPVNDAALVGYDRSTGTVLYPKRDPREGDRILYAVDPKDDGRVVVDRASTSALDWVLDSAGEAMYRVDFDARAAQLTLLSHQSGQWEVVATKPTTVRQLSVFGLNDAGAIVVGARPGGGGRFGLYALSPETGEIGDPIYMHERLDVARVRVDPYTNRVVGATVIDESPIWFDRELAEHQGLLDETFPGENPNLASWSEDRKRFIVTTTPADRVPGIYFYDAVAPSVDQIGATYTALQNVRLPTRSPYTYPARDGTAIPAYLTRPIDADGPTPLVVLPHDGPAARDVEGFDWMAHFLAARGFAVLQPNYRGSGGYGEAWERAGAGQWGIGVAQHDLSDGVAALVAAGIADPERVCIVGTSFGGYAALAGAVFTPELYRCAAAIGPMTDLEALLGPEPDRRNPADPTVMGWRLAMAGGEPAQLGERLRAASPAAHADQARASVLLIHASGDPVVPLAQSQTMQRALEAAGKAVELVELDGADHWLAEGETRVATLAALDRFLTQQLQN